MLEGRGPEGDAELDMDVDCEGLAVGDAVTDEDREEDVLPDAERDWSPEKEVEGEGDVVHKLVIDTENDGEPVVMELKEGEFEGEGEEEDDLDAEGE